MPTAMILGINAGPNVASAIDLMKNDEMNNNKAKMIEIIGITNSLVFGFTSCISNLRLGHYSQAVSLPRRLLQNHVDIRLIFSFLLLHEGHSLIGRKKISNHVVSKHAFLVGIGLCCLLHRSRECIYD